MLFGKSLADLAQLTGMPAPEANTLVQEQSQVLATSSTQFVDGTIVEQPTSDTAPTVIGAVMQSMRNAVSSKSTLLTKAQVDTLPYFDVLNMSCCGYMDVSGIQDAYRHSRTIEQILLGCVAATHRAHKRYQEKTREIDKLYAQIAEAREKHTGGENFHHSKVYEDLQNEVYRVERERMSNQKLNVAGAFIFTYVSGYGTHFPKQLTEFVKEHGLGVVTVVPAFYNPNSHNQVHTVILGLHNENFAKFISERLPKD
jgi:hypothetical protein